MHCSYRSGGEWVEPWSELSAVRVLLPATELSPIVAVGAGFEPDRCDVHFSARKGSGMQVCGVALRVHSL